MNEKKTSALLRGAIAENPVLVLFLGACPAMAMSANVVSALGMGLAVTVVMLLSAIVISALGKTIPGKARIAAYILITAGFVSVVQLLMNAFLPSVYNMLGVYLAVAAVDLVIFSGNEDAAGTKVGTAVLNSVVTGLGFTAAIFVMALVREFFGSGSFAGIKIPFMADFTVPVLAKTPGGFIVFAILLAVINSVCEAKTAEKKSLACAAAGLCDAENNA